MSLIIDLVILIIIALFTLIGYHQGLIKSAIKILAFFIAIIIAVMLYKPVSTFIINNTDIDERIQNTITAKILPEGMSEDDNIDEGTIKSTIVNTANTTVKKVSADLTVKIIQVISFILLYIIAKILLMFVSALSTLITKIPGIKQIDKAGGFIYGLLKGILIVLVIFAIINMLSPLIQTDYINLIDETHIAKRIYNDNIILNIIR